MRDLPGHYFILFFERDHVLLACRVKKENGVRMEQGLFFLLEPDFAAGSFS